MATFIARAHRHLRRSLGPAISPAPRWDMLLDLYANEHHRPLSVTDLCIACDASQRTAIRQINAMVREGMLRTKKDPRDGRRTIVELAPGTTRLLNRYFDELLDLITDTPTKPR